MDSVVPLPPAGVCFKREKFIQVHHELSFIFFTFSHSFFRPWITLKGWLLCWCFPSRPLEFRTSGSFKGWFRILPESAKKRNDRTYQQRLCWLCQSLRQLGWAWCSHLKSTTTSYFHRNRNHGDTVNILWNLKFTSFFFVAGCWKNIEKCPFHTSNYPQWEAVCEGEKTFVGKHHENPSFIR